VERCPSACKVSKLTDVTETDPRAEEAKDALDYLVSLGLNAAPFPITPPVGQRCPGSTSESARRLCGASFAAALRRRSTCREF